MIQQVIAIFRTALITFVVGLAFILCVRVYAELGTNNSVSVTQTAQTITLGTTSSPAMDVFVQNDAASTNELYYRLFSCGETVAAATSSNGARLQPGDFRSYRHAQTEPGQGYCALSIVCATGETATARVEWK